MKYVQTLALIAILCSCGTYQQGNFNKQKFTNLKSIDAQSTATTENNLAFNSADEANDEKIVHSNLSTELPVTSEKPVLAEKTQETTNTTKQIVSNELSELKKRITKTANKVKILISEKRRVQKQERNEGAMAAGIVGAIIFFCLAVFCGLLALAFIELGFTGVIWGIGAAACLLLGILFLVLALTQSN